MLFIIDGINQYGKHYFTAGAIVDDESERVVEAAPIIKYMVGWHMEKVQTYCAKKGWFAKLFNY